MESLEKKVLEGLGIVADVIYDKEGSSVTCFDDKSQYDGIVHCRRSNRLSVLANFSIDTQYKEGIGITLYDGPGIPNSNETYEFSLPYSLNK